MPIVRLIFVTVKPNEVAAAERIWKEDCAPLMIKQEGCLTEELLRAVDKPGELISYSVWESQESIERYAASPAHEEIKRHAKGLKLDDPPEVKHYELV